jgi:5-(carboxyamino)imidazole ribonucleotide mutase
MKTVAVIMGSDSDLPIVGGAIKQLRELGIGTEARVISAHRTPDEAADFARGAAARGVGVIIAAAGKAAHLAGIIAAHTVLPVIGLPIKSSTMDGLDSLLSTVQMPSGVPVAAVAIDGAQNAGLLAARILALGDAALTERLVEYREEMRVRVLEKDKKLQEGFGT